MLRIKLLGLFFAFLIPFVISLTLDSCELRINNDHTKVKGTVYVKGGNQFPKIKNLSIQNINKTPIYEFKVIAVEGKVFNKQTKKLIPLDLIDQNFKEINIDKKGKFESCMKKGIYTFFISDGYYAYLNNFDGNGFFITKKVDKEVLDMFLILDPDAFY